MMTNSTTKKFAMSRRIASSMLMRKAEKSRPRRK